MGAQGEHIKASKGYRHTMYSQVWVLLVAAIAATSAAPLMSTQDSNQDHVIKPLAAKSGPEKMLVFIPGANVPTENYLPTVNAIQEASDLRLWVVIPAMPGKRCVILCPTASICAPLQSYVKSILSKATGQGWNGTSFAPDTFIAGHSLGGICAQTLSIAYPSPGYQALTVLGAYTEAITGPNSVQNFPIPVMTVGAELDGGLGRPAMIGARLRASDEAAKSNGTDWQIQKAPVLILPGLDHSSFCPGFSVPGDVFPAEATQEQAMNATGSIVSAFLELHSSKVISVAPSAPATAEIEAAMAWTREFLNPFEQAYKLEAGNNGNNHLTSPWCQKAQTILSGSPAAQRVRVNPVVYKDDAHQFEHTRVGYRADSAGIVLNASSHNDYYSGISTGCLVPAASVDCKMVSSERVAQLLNITNNTSPSCKDVNQVAVNTALAILSNSGPTANKTLSRYMERGRTIAFADDFAPFENIGPLFIKGSLKITDSAEGITVSSIAIHTQLNSTLFPGVHYCKLLSPARVLDYIYTDSLKKKSGCLNV